MSNKLKQKAKEKPKKMAIRAGQRINGTPVKKKASVKKPKSLVQNNPKLTILVLLVTYWL